jgi:hypothetical protein
MHMRLHYGPYIERLVMAAPQWGYRETFRRLVRLFTNIRLAQLDPPGEL